MRTVLIADDEPITRMDLADMLREQGFRVVGQAADGFDAVELCRSQRPDVVLMDVKMPVFDGLAASERILSQDLAGCVVLLTAFHDQDIVRQASLAGVTGYLVKPIDTRALLPTIEVALAQSQRLRESREQAEKARRQVREDRLVHKAQRLLAQSQGCSETEAYQLMRRTAMNKRMPVAELARHILDQQGRPDDMAVVKRYLMMDQHMSENRAFRQIGEYAKAHGCSMEEAARRLRASLPAED